MHSGATPRSSVLIAVVNLLRTASRRCPPRMYAAARTRSKRHALGRQLQGGRYTLLKEVDVEILHVAAGTAQGAYIAER